MSPLLTARAPVRELELPLRRGLRLHKYRIEKRLGEGRFAVVFQAFDRIEGVHVALKVFTPRSSVAQHMFAHEARVAVLLEHPNILRLKTAEIIAGHYVLVTELADRTLSEALERPRSARFGLHVLNGVLQGLAFAHERGIIHRDIKPENILLWKDGRVKLADFGVARFAEPATHTTVTGTPSYRAPEQAYGRPTFASDVFAVALVFFEMMTRVLPTWPFRWPFEGADRLTARIPAEVLAIVRRAASFDLDRRYRDAGAMLSALHRAVPELGAEPATFGVPPARRLTWQQYRQREFEHRFGRRLALDFRCHECRGPISEFMTACPWCGTLGNSFFRMASFPAVCAGCERGVHDDWRFCPWCYGARFRNVSRQASQDRRYGGRCPNPRCHETRLLPHMKHCPWCNARLRPWRSRVLAGQCPSCKASVAGDYWEHCAWCGKDLVVHGRRGRRSGRSA